MDSETFGQRRPPLSVTIKGILERYPDGQIFKEMIQNADDAGAKTVWFYVDERHHGTSNLPHPDLARFQGPALVAANDACFTDEDWEGIQNLQQSIKADDPFKVGRFGIGFNSVYHLTDLPIIVSGKKLACFEPQEKMWKGEAGQSFNLPNLLQQSSDFVAPLSSLAGFENYSVGYNGYPHTIFRLPLRTAASGLSENVYNPQKLLELLDALREEAKLLLLFLKSVCKIEVIRISPHNQHSTLFCVEIATPSLTAERDRFMQQLKQAHSARPYMITNVISFTARFSVTVTDNSPRHNQGGTTHWLIANSVGSSDQTVLAAATKQHTFPWVGVALEIGAKESAGGRIFCFLPMPVEASSGLPVHVNGTFGLNDERRSLKWPGIERRNDPTADWNKVLVSNLLPLCYSKLLIEAKQHLKPLSFYEMWPDARVVESTQFSEVLQPLFTDLFSQEVVWTENTVALRMAGSWIRTSQATFISQSTTLPSVVRKVLHSCGVQVVDIPDVIWRAIQHVRLPVTEVSPNLTRSKLRSYSGSYSIVDPYGKRVILTYCLSDGCYHDLGGLYLLPLVDGSFTNFDVGYQQQLVYLCSSDYPRTLLPNLNHLLVDLSEEDSSLNMSLYQVASYQQTKLRVLTEREVASLLPQALPSEWQYQNVVSLPHSKIPHQWLQTFWKWLKKKNIKLFNNQFLFPCYTSTSDSLQRYSLSRLHTNQPVVYINQHTLCSGSLLSALYKMNMRICQQTVFSFVEHRQLTSYTHQLQTNSVLDVAYSHSNYQRVTFTEDEADSLRSFLISGSYKPSNSRKVVLQHLAIFSSAANSSSQLYSVSSAASQSVARKALGEPSDSVISVTNLPPGLILFSRGNHDQLRLLNALSIPFPSDYQLFADYIIPLIRNRTFPDRLIDNLMIQVLDEYYALYRRGRGGDLNKLLQTLRFVKSSGVRKAPSELFDPHNTEVVALYSEEQVFPEDPYDTPQRVQVLRQCGLQTSVSPQQLLDIAYSISSSCSSEPQQVNSTRYSRAKAVLEYISERFGGYHQQTFSGYYSLAIRSGSYFFSDALRQLAMRRNWLPVLANAPSDYCRDLPWKGDDYDSHFVSLNSSVAVLTPSTSSTLPHLVGSQMYLVSPTVYPKVANMLSTNFVHIAQHVVAHFREILCHKDDLSADEMESLVHRVYQYMNNEGASALNQLYAIEEWVYIKRENKFVSPDLVALGKNSAFRRDLEPYIYILSDSLSRYTTLFGTASGVERTVSEEQILSVLTSIKEDVEMETQRTTAAEAWDTIMSILNWLTNNGNDRISESIDPYVPVETDSEWPMLVTASVIVYTDNDFLKNYLQSSEEENNYTFVHSHVGAKLARSLGVVPLTEFLDISEDTFEDAGQYEPLTTRLKNILRDYKDGLTIIKELLQNADDAEATEVNICYDARQHETEQKKLFFSGMADAHGPALIIHNNSTFSDEDFANITKLAAATKQAKKLKIGKFGVGFCSVYHMTDVPSFVSRDRLFIFDPTLKCLKKEIKNPSQPGKKIVFTHKIISKSDQLSPYDGLYGFDRTEYEGTMFRLPFRSHASELSGTCYSEGTVGELISAIRDSSEKLLLFLQHVRKITFNRIDPGQSTPQVLLQITREMVEPTVSLPVGTEIRSLSCADSSGDSTERQWLVSLEKEEDFSQKYYTASVACPLGSSAYQVDPDFEGEIFCFLPLSQKTGLPVHVSGNFAVNNNRRGIWTSDDATNKTDREVDWNITLMRGVIPNAYHNLLLTLKMLTEEGVLPEYEFHSLWPKTDDLLQHNPWEEMLSELYSLISEDELFCSAALKQWLPLSECKFLEPKIMCLSHDASTPACVLTIVQHLNVPVVDLPHDYHSHFDLDELMVGEKEFIELFFDNIDSLDSILCERNEAIKCMLEHYTVNEDREDDLEYYLKLSPTIPCSPDGVQLRRCEELIDPESKFAPLFDEDEARFPVKMLTQHDLSLAALRRLGMLSSAIPQHMLVERATTVSTLYQTDKTKALKRTQLIIAACPNESIMSDDEEMISDYTASETELSEIPFLPVLGKPVGYPLTWGGDGHQLMCGEALTMPGVKASNLYTEVAGSQTIFVNTRPIEEGGCGEIDEGKMLILGISASPSIEMVVSHFKELIEQFPSREHSTELVQRTDQMCRKVYEFFDNKLKEVPTSNFIEQLKEMECIWTGQKFITVSVVAKDWTRKGPYLFPVPPSLSFRKNLSEALDIKEEFTLTDVEGVLAEMKRDFGDDPISEPAQEVFMKLVPLLEKAKADKCHIMLPDERFVMHPSNELTFNDAPWAPKDSKYTYVHERITRPVAIKFEVKPVRSQFLDKFVSSKETHFRGERFGQREDLTRRIQNILEGYPLDITVLKELLQNADDAKATKMYVILDKRKHGQKQILSENWGKLQGPALLVWNDSEFSEKDLKGIQELGLGSKRSDDETIGQYGIGFNVVYHLTDCPSFITGGETMCVLDPHCHFVPGADVVDPGRRFDHLESEGFWDTFVDMQSAYLRSKLDNCPSEVQKRGSLFRFPLRHTQELVDMSSIIKKDKRLQPKPLTADSLHECLKEWAPSMKEAMLFLNHVAELRFFVIEENSHSLFTMNNYRTNVDQLAQDCRIQLHSALSAFKEETGSTSSLVCYPLTISTVTHKKGGEQLVKEKWLVQQGVGDIENEQQTWKYIGSVKPRHGIAAPLELPPPLTTPSEPFVRQKTICGQLFCFLPLPVETKLPVHINGHFVLDANRRELWHSTDPNREDDKSAWNRKLFEAIASSYTSFLESVQRFYVSKDEYKSYHDAFEALNQYYDIFPHGKLEGQYQTLTERVYAKMIAHNSSVLAVVSQCSESKKLTVKWCPVRSDTSSSQVYFWSATSYAEGIPEYERKHIKPLLEAMGMQLTAAPSRIKSQLNKAITDKASKLQDTTPSSVYQYYKQFSEQVITTEASTCTFPCHISNTVFKRPEVFKRLTEYLLGGSDKFPNNDPFGCPLLLTADSVLRRFDACLKVLRSEYSSLFEGKPHLFLHPKLLKVTYSDEYFAQDSNNEALILEILNSELPPQLKVCKVLDFDSVISVERLRSLWECFNKDHAFSSKLDTILKQWALIPTNRGHLYSLSSKVLPVYPEGSRSLLSVVTELVSSSSRVMCDVLSTLKMPFIDTSLIAGCSLACPHLAQQAAILKNLFFLSQEVSFSDLLTKDMVKSIFKYVKYIDFRSDRDSLRYIRSLPLFENVDGTFSTIEGKTTFEWHYSACTAGFRKWIRCYDVIFLSYSGAWSEVGTEQLEIRAISAEEIYSQYIFKAFDTMDEKERYEHLKHIKDSLFATNKSNCQPYMSKRNYHIYYRAYTFIDWLERLPCIGKSGEVLRPVRDFCDHTLRIFTAFEREYRFLPEFFTKDVWLQWSYFFKQLKLRQTVDKKEFLRLCYLAADSHEDPEDASKVLLDHFISKDVEKEGWHSDHFHVKQVSNIAFVPAEQLPELSWIKSPYRPADRGRQIYKGQRLIELTKLSGTALADDKECLWTVKPIVKLPFDYSWRSNLLCSLGVSEKATVQNVVDNVKNIASTSKFTDFKLFDKYPPTSEPPEKDTSLTKVMEKQFKFLQDRLPSLSSNIIDALKSTPCIPVPVTAERSHMHKWKVVLVKPCMVISGDTQGFHPFLHSVPFELISYLGLLQRLGVGVMVTLKHCQLVLEAVYKHSEEQKLDKNSKACADKAIKCIHQLLSSHRNGDPSQELKPLYLPSSEGKLVLSSGLLYTDSPSFFGPIKDSFQDHRYSLLRLPPKNDFGFSEKDFCEALPELVRPLGMSEICDQRILDEYKVPLPPCEVHTRLEKTLTMTEQLPKAISAVVRYQAREKVNDLEDLFRTFISSVKIITVKKVRTVITVKDTGALVGHLDLQFHLQYEQHKSNDLLCVYLTLKADEINVGYIVKALSEKLVRIIKKEHPNIQALWLRKIAEVLTTLLRLQTPTQIEQVLQRESIPYITDDSTMEEVEMELGKDVPADWHHRLDQSIDNVFHPGEIVGYEIEEDHIVFARIMHPVLPEGSTIDSVQNVNMRYRIYTSPVDDEGTEVGILKLYKFLRGLKPAKPVNEEEKGLVFVGRETDPTRIQRRLREEDLEEITRELKKQLDEIWKLPEEDRNKAIRRLYLRWHPDKNPDNVDLAEKVFKFLNSEIDRRKSGYFDREDLDRTASRHRRNFYREQRYYSRQSHSYPSGSRARGGAHASDDDENFGSSGWGTSSPSASDPFTDQNLQPEPDPEEGKRWLKQAEANFESLSALHQAAAHNRKICGDVCFMAHQVAEKALKGGKYFVCGLDANSLVSHNLSTHAYALQSLRPGDTHGLVASTTPLEVYYLEPRYPNRWPSGVVPADHYTFQAHADPAWQRAKAILEIIKTIIVE